MRDQPDLFGQVASTPTAYRVIESIGPEEVERLREARRPARARAWQMGAAPTEIVLDFDAALITRTRKRKARPATTSAASASARSSATWTKAVRHWLDCCARETPAPTPSVTTWKHWPRLCASYPRAHRRSLAHRSPYRPEAAAELPFDLASPAGDGVPLRRAPREPRRASFPN